MIRHVVFASIAITLASLTGCSRDRDAEVQERLNQLMFENLRLQARLDTLSRNVGPLQETVRELDAQNRRLETTLARAEEDLRTRLGEMVQQDGGGGARRLVRQPRPPALPKPYLGFNGETNSPEMATRLKLGTDTGVVVTAVTAGAPAAAGGLQANDVIQQFNGEAAQSKEQLAAAIGRALPGQECTVGVVRGQQRVELKVKLGAK